MIAPTMPKSIGKSCAITAPSNASIHCSVNFKTLRYRDNSRSNCSPASASNLSFCIEPASSRSRNSCVSLRRFCICRARQPGSCALGSLPTRAYGAEEDAERAGGNPKLIINPTPISAPICRISVVMTGVAEWSDESGCRRRSPSSARFFRGFHVVISLGHDREIGVASRVRPRARRLPVRSCGGSRTFPGKNCIGGIAP